MQPIPQPDHKKDMPEAFPYLKTGCPEKYKVGAGTYMLFLYWICDIWNTSLQSKDYGQQWGFPNQINPHSPIRRKRFRRTVWDTFQNLAQFYSAEVTKETFNAKINKRLCITRWNAVDSPGKNFCCPSNKPIQFATALLLSYAKHLLINSKYIHLLVFQIQFWGYFFHKEVQHTYE